MLTQYEARGGAYSYRAPDISVRLQEQHEWTVRPFPLQYKFPPDHLQTQIVVLGAAPAWETETKMPHLYKSTLCLQALISHRLKRRPFSPRALGATFAEIPLVAF